MKIDLERKVALVTGAGGGIGRAIAVQLGECGARVIVHYLSNRQGAEQTAEAIRSAGGEAAVWQADLTDLDQIGGFVELAKEQFDDAVTILVNNAGNLVGRRTTEQLTYAFYKEVIDVNLTSAVFVSQAAVPGMKAKQEGVILHLGSLAAHNGGGPGSAVYAAAKGAVMALSKAQAKELAPFGIRVNCLSPGFIEDTKFHSTFTTADGRLAAIAAIPVGRGGLPRDVSGMAAFLASSGGAFITGETIEINGGSLMR